MKTIVKHISGYGLTATLKKHLIAVVESENKEYFGKRLKVNNIKMMVEELGENKYKVIEFCSRPSMISSGKYETSFENIVEIIKR